MHFSLICLVFLPLVVCCYNVHLYEDSFHDGRVHRVVSGTCEDIPVKMKDRISSINTHGTCIFIYKSSGCRGDWAVIAPGTYGHSNLEDISFDDIVNAPLSDVMEDEPSADRPLAELKSLILDQMEQIGTANEHTS